MLQDPASSENKKTLDIDYLHDFQKKNSVFFYDLCVFCENHTLTLVKVPESIDIVLLNEIYLKILINPRKMETPAQF